MPSAEIVKWGNSLAIRIPKAIAQEAGVHEGDAVVIEASRGRIQVRRRKQAVPSLGELVAQITPENRYQELETGTDRGAENVEW